MFFDPFADAALTERIRIALGTAMFTLIAQGSTKEKPALCDAGEH